jgi:hypothetical protein
METQQGDKVEAGNQDSPQSHILCILWQPFHQVLLQQLTATSISSCPVNCLQHNGFYIHTTCIIIKHLYNLYTL